MIYSTDPDFELNDDSIEEEETLPPAQQDLRITLDRLKGNKKATVVYDFIGTTDDLKELGKHLKNKCGVGGSVKNGEILLQGDLRNKVGDELKKMGYKFKFVGG